MTPRAARKVRFSARSGARARLAGAAQIGRAGAEGTPPAPVARAERPAPRPASSTLDLSRSDLFQLQLFLAYWPRAKTLRRGCESRPRPDEALLSLAFRTPEPKSGRPRHRGLTWVTMRPALRPATADQSSRNQEEGSSYAIAAPPFRGGWAGHGGSCPL